MAESGDHKRVIVSCLQRVEAQRADRAADGVLNDRVLAVKRFQQRRFERTYPDLLASNRHGAASRFFLQELYGPADFSVRDQQFERIVPKLVRLFPAEVVSTIAELARLHADTEELDSAMGRQIASSRCDRESYVRAWRTVGMRQVREDQLRRVLAIGESLNRLTTHAWIVRLLRLMRGPAEAAGLGQLQQFLETGLAGFCSMNGAGEFLQTVGQRERAIMSALFDERCTLPRANGVVEDWLARLPESA